MKRSMILLGLVALTSWTAARPVQALPPLVPVPCEFIQGTVCNTDYAMKDCRMESGDKGVCGCNPGSHPGDPSTWDCPVG